MNLMDKEITLTHDITELLYRGFIQIPRRIASDILPFLDQSPERAVRLAVITLSQHAEAPPGLFD